MAAGTSPYFKHSFQRTLDQVTTEEEFYLEQVSSKKDSCESSNIEEPIQGEAEEKSGRVPDKVAVVVSEIERRVTTMDVKSEPPDLGREAVLDALTWPSELAKNAGKQKSPLEDTLRKQVQELSEQDLDTFIYELTGLDRKSYLSAAKLPYVKIMWAANTLKRIRTGVQQCPYPRDKVQFELAQNNGSISRKANWASIWPGLAKLDFK